MAEVCWKVMAATFLLATAFMNLSELQWMGTLGTLATMVVAAAIIITAVGAATGHGAEGGVHSVNWTAPSLSALMGTITSFCYSYGAVCTLPAIAQDMEDREKDLKPAVHYAHVLSTVVYLLIGLIAYLSFGNTVQPDVLDGLKTQSKPLWYIGVGGILVHVVMVVPLFIQVSVAFVEERLPATWWTPTAVRVGLVLMLLVLACTPIHYFADFVGIVPATLVTLNCFVWPTLMYWGLVAKTRGSLRGAVLKQPWKFSGDVLIVAAAVMAMVLGTKAGIEHLIDKVSQGGH
jgi:amino acid permease